MNWATFTPQIKKLYGVYSDDFITFGEFSKEAGDPNKDENLLLKICDEDDNTTVPDRTTIRFEDNTLYFKRIVNGKVIDSEIEHQVDEAKLHPHIDQSWSELFFYGVGNKNI